MEVNGVYTLFEALQLTPMLTPTLYVNRPLNNKMLNYLLWHYPELSVLFITFRLQLIHKCTLQYMDRQNHGEK